MAIIQPTQLYIDETADPALLMNRIALAKQDGGIVVFETPKDIFVTAVEERVTYQQIKNIVNDPAGNLNGEIQFGNNGSFGADKDFRYDINTDILSLSGGLVTGNIVVARNTNLGSIANVTITGGLAGQFLSTDGSGDLSWQTPPSVVALPVGNGSSQLNIPVASGAVTITANGTSIWSFNTTGYLDLPNVTIGPGSNEQAQVGSQRKIIPGSRSSATVPDSETPTVVYEVSSSAIVAFKTVLAIQHGAGSFEFVEVFASRSGPDVSYTVTNRIAPAILPTTTVVVDIASSGKLRVTLTTHTVSPESAWVTYDAIEFGRPTA